MMSVFLILLGFVGLYFGAEWLVKGSSGMALRLGLSPLLVGLTVVAWGTSAPELVVSLVASFNGQSAIALGNVVGSNILNIGLILGVTAAIVPLNMHRQVLRFDAPVMLAATGLFCFFFRDHTLSRGESAVLLVVLVGYTWIALRSARKHVPEEGSGELQDEVKELAGASLLPVGTIVLLIVSGLITLLLGSKAFVSGAVDLATRMGVSEAVIGLTIVAAGTSLPELAACVVAALRGQGDIAVGNVVGSNIYNLLAIGGISGSVAGPLHGGDLTFTDMGTMAGLTVLMLIVGLTGFRIRRAEGVLLIACYVGYIVWIWPK